MLDMFMMRSATRTRNQARHLRGHLSRSEVLLWVRLRARAPETPTFRRQHPIGPYITDFCCSTARLVVEIDGGVHSVADRMLRDAEREQFLREQGYRILRLSDKDVLRDPDAAAARILGEAGVPPPSGSA
jgi:very-short-patch-repair endonuclease